MGVVGGWSSLGWVWLVGGAAWGGCGWWVEQLGVGVVGGWSSLGWVWLVGGAAIVSLEWMWLGVDLHLRGGGGGGGGGGGWLKV